jgi:hypothetical protein
MKVKEKFHTKIGNEGPDWEYRYSSTLCLTSALEAGEWSTPPPVALAQKSAPAPIAQEDGWAQIHCEEVQKNLALTGIRSPYRLAHD